MTEEITDFIPRDVSRRGFLRASSLGSAALALGGAGVLAACDPVALLGVNIDRLRLHPFFTSRIVATTGVNVAGTTHEWHLWPDGGATFALPDGGWSYVSNCEWFFVNQQPGVSYIRFDADANIVDAGACLTGTLVNCAGGKTPWQTWLSCEEHDNGHVWECDPIGAVPGVQRPSMGKFKHEAAACEAVGQKIYMTEDHADGGFYRFTPTTWGDLTAGLLEILTEPTAGTLVWAAVPDPSAAVTPTRHQLADTKPFNGGEGIDISLGKVILATKGDNKVWSYDPVGHTLGVIRTTRPSRSTASWPGSTTWRRRMTASSTWPRTATTCRSCCCGPTARPSPSCRWSAPPTPRSPGRPSTHRAPASTSARSAIPGRRSRCTARGPRSPSPVPSSGLPDPARRSRSPTSNRCSSRSAPHRADVRSGR